MAESGHYVKLRASTVLPRGRALAAGYRNRENDPYTLNRAGQPMAVPGLSDEQGKVGTCAVSEPETVCSA